MGELAGPRHPIGFCGRGRQIWADALFLRRPETVIRDRQLEKLAFTSLVFGHIEFAHGCLGRIDLGADDPTQYDQFIRLV